MSVLTVFLTGGDNEAATASVEDFVKSCVNVGKHDRIEIVVVTHQDLEANVAGNKSSDPRELLMAKNLEKRIESEKKSGDSKGKGGKREDAGCEVRVLLLHNYPSTEAEMLALMHPTFKYPLLDSVVRVVYKKTGEVLRYFLVY